MHVFIFSELYDAHAIIVAAALTEMGVAVTRFLGDTMPEVATVACAIENSFSKTQIFSNENNLAFASTAPVDVVWLRRAAPPSTDVLQVHTDDLPVIAAECREFWQSFITFSFQTAKWVNPSAAARTGRSKMHQLTLAAKCGLQIPATLVANNPAAIRDFIETNNAPGRFGTIMKTFRPVRWEHAAGVSMVYTAKIDQTNLPADYLLQVIPAIYQARVEKAFEVRSTFFGELGFHVEITAKKDGDHVQDWRTGHYTGLTVLPHTLPEEITAKCIHLMAELGIRFGCFDFIVTPDGEYVFLEVNEAGQFLWVENYCPTMPLLAEFCKFLIRESATGFVPKLEKDFAVQAVSEWPHVKMALKDEREQYVDRKT
jgi:glutathione synthase/RimK-type ligase-like ATP-grasp enzyme